jgi:hypothetical protein
MRALQPRNWPATALRFCGCVAIDFRSLDEAGRDMVPVGEFDRVVEPGDMQSWKFTFELGERDRIAGQDIQADERRASRIARKPFRPNRKSSVRPGKAPDEIAKSWPDRRGRALRRGHVSIHNDYAPHGQLGRQIGDQCARRAMTHHNRFIAGCHMFEKMRGPCTPRRRRVMVGQYVRHLDMTSCRPQMPGRRLPARRPDQRSCDKNEI